MLHGKRTEIRSFYATRSYGQCGVCGNPMEERQRLAFRRQAGHWTPGEVVHFACHKVEDELLASAEAA